MNAYETTRKILDESEALAERLIANARTLACIDEPAAEHIRVMALRSTVCRLDRLFNN